MSEHHHHDHQVVPSDPTLRVKALESLLAEKGLVDPAALPSAQPCSTGKLPAGCSCNPIISASSWTKRFWLVTASVHPNKPIGICRL